MTFQIITNKFLYLSKGDTTTLMVIQAKGIMKMQEYIDKLHELGLSGREAEIYLALLMRKELSAPEIAKITSVTRTKIYELLQNLVKKKVCNETFKNGTKVFSSVEPTIAIQNMLAVFEDELNRKKKLTEKFGEELMQLHQMKEVITDPLDYIEILTDTRQIQKKWLELQEFITREILVFTKPPYIVQSIEENIGPESEVLKNNTSAKSIYEYGSLRSPEETENLIKAVEAFEKLGEEARLIEKLPMKLAIIDEKITLMSLPDPVSLTPTLTTMIVSHPIFATAQKEVFNNYWNKSISLDEYKKKLELQKTD